MNTYDVYSILKKDDFVDTAVRNLFKFKKYSLVTMVAYDNDTEYTLFFYKQLSR